MGPPPLRSRAAAEGGALVHQRGDRHLPAVAFLAEHVAVRNAHVVQEDLVELGLGGDLVEGAHVDAGALHVEQEVRQPFVLRQVGVAAGDEHAPLGDVRQGGPHLLAVEHPVVAVADRARGQAGDVGAGARLAEHLAPDVLAREDAAQQRLLHVVGAVGQEDRRAHADADRVDVQVVVGGLRLLAQLVGDDRLHLRVQPEAAEAFGEVDPGEAVVVLGAAERELVDLVGMHGGDQLADALAQLLLGHGGLRAHRLSSSGVSAAVDAARHGISGADRRRDSA